MGLLTVFQLFQVSNTGSWMVQAGGGGGGGRVGVDNNVLLSSLASPEALEAAAQSVSQELLDDAILSTFRDLGRTRIVIM